MTLSTALMVGPWPHFGQAFTEVADGSIITLRKRMGPVEVALNNILGKVSRQLFREPSARWSKSFC